jgi:alkylhydroperoxidase/carboxymuconolactone decarboxylase family protein YurZ
LPSPGRIRRRTVLTAARPSRTKGSIMAESTSETPVLDLLADMTANSVAASSLDPETLMLVRIAALVAVDAPSFSYVLNLEMASELDIDPERIRGVLAAIAPIVGTPRVASATGKIVEALAVEMEIAELEELSEEIVDEEVYDQVDDEVEDDQADDEVEDEDEDVEDDEVEDEEVEDDEVEDDEVEDEDEEMDRG